MSRSQKSSPDLQEIARWTRAYAQNRSLPMVVLILILLALNVAIGGASYLGGMGYRSGNMLLFWGSVLVLLPAVAAVVYLSVPKWFGNLQERIVQHLYAREGNVAFSLQSRHAKGWAVVLCVCFPACILASVTLFFVFDIPLKYMQPISALYLVPFLVGLWLLMRPMAGWATLLWPLLYAIHAILIVVGAPILFTGPWDPLNMLIPTAGYGILAGLVGHLYSRVALRQLKRLTQTDWTAADHTEETHGS